MPGTWDYRRYGTLPDPIHKSHLNSITGDYGCPKQFRYQMDARVASPDHSDTDVAVSGKTAAGTAVHETIARALAKLDDSRRVPRWQYSEAQVRAVFMQEFERETRGREVLWYDKSGETILADRVAMVRGLLNDLHRHVATVELVEPGFIVQCGDYWLSGHIDLVYRPSAAPDRLAISDWKTGSAKPIEIELDHSWEAGVYSAALFGGRFLPREVVVVSAEADGRHTASVRLGPNSFSSATRVSRYVAERDALEAALIELASGRGEWLRPVTFEEFPKQVHYVALQDYVPYKRAGSRQVSRREDLQHYGYDAPRSHKYVAGDTRGAAWLPVQITEHDVPRLAARLRNVVGMIRMGRFIDQVGERCRRCAWADDCLHSGYAPQGSERQQLELALRKSHYDPTEDGLSDA